MLIGLIAVGMGLAGPVAGQTLVQVKRLDGAMTPIMVYGSAMKDGACSPVVVFSHGAGGSERGYSYLADGLAKRGWFVLVPGHRESGALVAQEDVRTQGSRRAGLQKLVATPSAYVARLQDVGAALDWAAARCTAKTRPFRALAGHSMGAETVMFEAGAKSSMDVANEGRDRFDAYVAMSPRGVGPLFSKTGWRGIHKPMFVLTGTLDDVLPGTERRQQSYAGLPGDHGCDWLGIIDGATHKSFGGRGPDPDRVNPEIVDAVDAFLRGARTGNCVLPPPVPGFALHSK